MSLEVDRVVKKENFVKKNSVALDSSNEERILFNPEDPSQMIDWMGYEINEENYVSPITDREVVETAVLSEKGCRGLSLAREQDKKLYENWLSTFTIIDRRTVEEPDEMLWDLMSELRLQTDLLAEQYGSEHRAARR